MDPLCGEDADYDAVTYDYIEMDDAEICYIHLARAQQSLVVRCPDGCYQCSCCLSALGCEGARCSNDYSEPLVDCCRFGCGPCCNVCIGNLSACWRRSRYHAKVTYANPLFEPASVFLVFVYMVVLMTRHSPSTPAYENALGTINDLFLIIFSIELVIRLVAQGFRAVCYDGWLAFDVVIVATSALVRPFNSQTVGQAGRALRVARVLRFLHLSPQLRILLNTLRNSAKPIFTVSVILFMSLFFFSVVGMELYGDIAAERRFPSTYIEEYPNLAEEFNVSVDATANDASYLAAVEKSKEPGQLPYEGFNRHAHFRTFAGALMTMLRSSTGEDWQTLYHDCRKVTQWASLFWFLL